jgi:hypothetical protein
MPAGADGYAGRRQITIRPIDHRSPEERAAVGLHELGHILPGRCTNALPIIGIPPSVIGGTAWSATTGMGQRSAACPFTHEMFTPLIVAVNLSAAHAGSAGANAVADRLAGSLTWRRTGNAA